MLKISAVGYDHKRSLRLYIVMAALQNVAKHWSTFVLSKGVKK